jgi:hypothetical protein
VKWETEYHADALDQTHPTGVTSFLGEGGGCYSLLLVSRICSSELFRKFVHYIIL